MFVADLSAISKISTHTLHYVTFNILMELFTKVFTSNEHFYSF